jgi:uncharacterized protein YdaU (DUF1376 family)
VKGFPYVPWYHGDFLRSTAGWTLNERAVYWMLLCAEWESGPLPDDLTRLAAIAGIGAGEIGALWPVVRKKFTKTRAGLINRRIEAHRADYAKYRKGQSERGRKGMGVRWGNRDGSNVVDLVRPRITTHD